MLYIIYTTGQCNLNCRYCGGSFPQKLVQWKINYSPENLDKIISMDKKPIIAFYGGEPLLNINIITKMMNRYSQAKFVIQSNGTLIKKLKPKYWLKFNTILLSIDGRKKVTNYYRGKKIYEKVICTAKWLRSIGFDNDLIARMTIGEISDVFLEVEHLLSVNLFDHIHWQLNVFWSKIWRNFDEWLEFSYKVGIRKLIQLWLKKAEEGIILNIVPFLAIINCIVKNEKILSPPCGAGVDSVSILPNGEIIACPIAVDVEWSKLGNIMNYTNFKNLKLVRLQEPCLTCDFLNFCGGRCLYANREKLWGEARYKTICDTTIYMIKQLLLIKNRILNLLNRKIININQIDYPQFNNTVEIIP